MRDFPVFTTENGVASLRFREVPYKGIAYITLRDSLYPEKLLQECVEFSRAVGAETIYASGNDILENFPLHTAVWRMSRQRDGIDETNAALFSVTESTLESWRKIYNEKMKTVPNAATMTRQDGEELLKQGGGYFVHAKEELLGIGIVRGDRVDAVAAVKSGAGKDVMLALCSAVFSESIQLEVASANLRAVKLYERLGFIKTQEISRWYDVGKSMFC